MSWQLAFPGQGFSQLREELMKFSPLEGAAILRCNAAPNHRLLVAAATTAQDPDYASQHVDYLELDPTFLAREVKAAREARQTLVLVHTHPFTDFPEFSTADDRGEARLVPALQERVRNRPHGALVLGRCGFRGRIYSGSNDLDEIAAIHSVGADLDIQRAERSNREIDGLFDRNVRAFGQDGQRRLSELKVGVVGLGGTGSLVVEQLAHLGVGRLVLIDYDNLDSTNLNRVVGATLADVGRPKVEIAREHVQRIAGEHIRVAAIPGSVIFRNIVVHLLDCDFVFSCTDTHGSRAIVNQLAYQYLIPAIDMGIRIDAVDGRVTSMAGRTQMLAPELACLQCHSLLDPEEVRRDLMTQAERVADSYIVGDAQPRPAVISFNGTVASLSVTMFLAAVTGMPIGARRVNFRIRESIVKPVDVQPTENCIVCSSSRGALAKGETWPLPVRETQ